MIFSLILPSLQSHHCAQAAWVVVLPQYNYSNSTMLQGNETGKVYSCTGSPHFPNPLFLDFTFLIGFNVHFLQKQMYHGCYETVTHKTYRN
jgi:hypothetical protein